MMMKQACYKLGEGWEPAAFRFLKCSLLGLLSKMLNFAKNIRYTGNIIMKIYVTDKYMSYDKLNGKHIIHKEKSPRLSYA